MMKINVHLDTRYNKKKKIYDIQWSWKDFTAPSQTLVELWQRCNLGLTYWTEIYKWFCSNRKWQHWSEIGHTGSGFLSSVKTLNIYSVLDSLYVLVTHIVCFSCSLSFKENMSKLTGRTFQKIMYHI